MNDNFEGIYLVSHCTEQPHCESCIGRGEALEFLENDLVEFRYPNNACPFCLTHLRLNKRFPMSEWKPLLDAKRFTLVSDPLKTHQERMRVVRAHEVRGKVRKP